MKKVSDKQKIKNEPKKERTKALHLWFLDLWDKLPTKKNCKSCGTPIWGECLSTYFDHLLEKSSYPEFELEINNIFYPICGDCHTKKGNGFPTPIHKTAIENAKKILLNE